MEQETMKAVRDAELAAEKTEKDGQRECEEILAAAKSQAVKAVESAVDAERDKAASALEAARQKGEVLQHAAVDAVKQEIAALHTAAGAKSADAKKLILSELI